MGRGQARPETQGWVSWGGGSQPPPHQLVGLGERCKLSHRCPGRSPGRLSGFLYFIDARVQTAFSGITIVQNIDSASALAFRWMCFFTLPKNFLIISGEGG